MTMDSTIGEEWKSVFPIGVVFNPPLLLSGPSAQPFLGPLIFNPILTSITRLFSSPSLLPPLSPPPILNLRRFLHTSASIPLSTSSTIASILGNLPHNDVASTICFNRLQFLRCPNTNNVIVFFPSGPNSDRVGFLVISVTGSGLEVRADGNGDVFTAQSGLNYQICGIVVNPVSHSSFELSTLGENFSVVIGYLWAFTMYSVDWFVVKTGGANSHSERVSLVYIGSKVFKTCSIVNACWSPHVPEESVILLESGELFLFDLQPFLETKIQNYNVHFRGTRLKVSWDDSGGPENYKWLSCDFSWHPRILIVARSDAVFLIDLRSDECNVSCLVKIEMFHMYTSTREKQFLAYSKAGCDGFHFALASDNLLLLCDVRKPMLPVLQWAHNLDKPCYIDVFRLSKLRAYAIIDKYKWASELGFCIVVGSFWTCEFNVFCYGPPLQAPSDSVASKISELYKSLYAWELPSSLLLSGRECPCGTCLVREHTLKDALPEWIEWQQKKEIVLGLGILDEDLSALLFEPDEYGGFTLIRLTSSGTLESQRYYASWNSLKKLEKPHVESLCLDNYLLYCMVDEEYRFPRRFRYLQFDYLMGFLNDNLAEVMDSHMQKDHSENVPSNESFCLELHEILCEKLKACGFGQLRSSPAIAVVFNDISLPSNIHEVALRRLWASLPIELLQLAYSNYSESIEASFEFLAVPDLLQLPPFFLRNPSGRSNKWSNKVRRPDALVGPLLPLPSLLTLHELRNGCSNFEEEGIQRFSLVLELVEQFNEVKRVAGEMVLSYSGKDIHDDLVFSLADDREDMSLSCQKQKPFGSYHTSAFKCSTANDVKSNSIYRDDVFDTMIFKVPEGKLISDNKSETVGLELFDDLCPMELRFDSHPSNFGPDELKAYNILKRQLSKWQEGFDLYQQFCSPSKCDKH